jgi:hypothetical protein
VLCMRREQGCFGAEIFGADLSQPVSINGVRVKTTPKCVDKWGNIYSDPIL